MAKLPEKPKSSGQLEANQRRRFLRNVMLLVTAWGAVLALGVACYGIDVESGTVTFSPNLIRGGITLTFVVGFVGFWALMVSLRERKLRTRDVAAKDSK